MQPVETLPLTDAARASVRVLIIDDEHTLRESCASVLSLEGYSVSASGNGNEAQSLLKRQRFDIVLLDLNMSQVPGLTLLETCLAEHPGTIAIIMTGNPSVTSSIAALQAGAWDYLPKPFAAGHLQILIGRAAHAALVARDSAQAGEAGVDAGDGDGPDLLGVSLAFRHVIELARKVAPTDASVLIFGESGTGKEQVAQFIHRNSRRGSRPMVPVNCAALPEALLESEMFGHLQGAFTDAVRDKQGLLEVANGGTLFLDEITEMSPVLQAKLLRVIQDGVVRRLGSNTTNAVVNVRFIAATNRPIGSGSDNSLREDLYYRLCVVPIHIPPLRERREDIPILARHFLARYWGQHRAGDDPAPLLGPDAIAALQSRPWAGNVRELQNVIEHAVVLAEPGSPIHPGDLPDMGGGPVLTDQQGGLLPVSYESMQDGTYHGVRERVLTTFETGYLMWLIDRARGNMSRAARIAGVDRTTLYRLMDKHGLQRDTVISAR